MESLVNQAVHSHSWTVKLEIADFCAMIWMPPSATTSLHVVPAVDISGYKYPKESMKPPRPHRIIFSEL